MAIKDDVTDTAVLHWAASRIAQPPRFHTQDKAHPRQPYFPPMVENDHSCSSLP